MSTSGASSSRRVKFDRSAEKSTVCTDTGFSTRTSSQFSRPNPLPGQTLNVSHFKVTTDLPSGVRTFLGEEPAIMMPVPLNWSSQDGEQQYLKDMYPTIPEFLRRDLELDFADTSARGTPCRFCGMEFGPAALITHQAKCKKEVEAANNDRTRGSEPGYLIRNWYSRGHPLKRLEQNKHVKECRYCHAAVPGHVFAQHEDECRSVMYGTTPMNGYH